MNFRIYVTSGDSLTRFLTSDFFIKPRLLGHCSQVKVFLHKTGILQDNQIKLTWLYH
jgi:hypothetical protein